MLRFLILDAYCGLTLFGPAFLGVSGIQGGGHIVPPLNIFGLGGVRVPILFGNDLGLMFDF